MAVAQPQLYCLRWNNHQHNLLSVFEDLLNHEAFVDVTLSCDGLNLKAHKMVLSACSPYFQSMFYNTPDKHPVVFLKDVRYEEMKALLEFMYRGEVSVDQQHLSSLLKVAESLKIKGLADVNESHAANLSSVSHHNPHHPHHHLPPLPLTSGSGQHVSAPPPTLIPSFMSTGGASALLSPSQLPPSSKRSQTDSSPHSSTAFLGSKRKRGRPRRLSGSDAGPTSAISLCDERMDEGGINSSPIPDNCITEHAQSPVKSRQEGNDAVSLSPTDLKTSDIPSEAESNDGRSSGLLMRDPYYHSKSKSALIIKQSHDEGTQYALHNTIESIPSHTTTINRLSTASFATTAAKQSSLTDAPARKASFMTANSTNSTATSARTTKPALSVTSSKAALHSSKDSLSQQMENSSNDGYNPEVIKLLETSLKTSLANRQITIQSFRLGHAADIEAPPLAQPVANAGTSQAAIKMRQNAADIIVKKDEEEKTRMSRESNGGHLLTTVTRHEEPIISQIKLEPGVVQAPAPNFANPLKLEIHENYVDSEGALIIAEENGGTLDYIVNEDGSCTCKLCGELTQSRTHWYRHKYKVHNLSLFRCDRCQVFFKSKKGYEGHVANRHAAPKMVSSQEFKPRNKKEVEGLNKVLKEIQAKKEAEMVQKIIEKVRAECEAQGEDAERRGYTKHHS